MSIAAKIAKIIAKAEGTDNAEEALIFMQKAHELMEKHGMDLLEVGRLNDDDPVGHEHEGIVVSSSWKRRLSAQVARFYGVDTVAVFGTKKTVKMTLVGRRDARETFKVMWPFILGQVNALASQGVKEGRYGTRGKAQRFIANALATRLTVIRREREAEDEAKGVTTTGLNALVPVDMIQAEMESAFSPGSLKDIRATSVKTSTNARRDAAKVNVDLQVGGGRYNANQIGRK
jgi:hypothetical protein